MLKPSIIGAGLGIFFFIAAHFFLTAYERCTLIQDTLGVSTGQARQLKEHEKERTQKKRNLERANRFVNRARSLGVEGDNWAYYDVNIEEPVSFEEAAKILRQTANSSSYYFKPVRLHVKTRVASNTKDTRNKAAATSADSPQTKQGDIVLTLRGSFAVRRK